MTTDLQLSLPPERAASELALIGEASTRLGIDANRIGGVKAVRRSIDARQRNIKVNVLLRVWVDEKPGDTPLACPVSYRPLPKGAPTAVVVGAGPAGLFAALALIEQGVRPVVLERGKDVDSRRLDTARLARTGSVDPDSNYCFGEGGAGAFSDGKLFTRSRKRGPVDRILQILHQHGAPEEILVETHPHIGTDRLPGVISNLRRTIERCGGRVEFGARVTSLLLDAQGRVEGVATADGRRFDGPVILATGHSARDTYRMLHQSGVEMLPKGIAVGVRLEHPQQVIDRVRYHKPGGRGPWLPPADYTMTAQVDGRGVYSFCMCPGGVIVPATSEEGLLVVNGMSASVRGSRWANSGMVVEVRPDDLPASLTGPLRMMHWQEQIERRFFADTHEAGCANSLDAPAQRMTDFVAGRPSASLPAGSYPPGMHPARVDRLLPPEVASRLRRGMEEFGRRNRGFLTAEAAVVGCETRTSAPVTLPRHPDTLEHLSTPGLWPAGEGAGQAGGIVSAAIDGDRCARALAAALTGRAGMPAATCP